MSETTSVEREGANAYKDHKTEEKLGKQKDKKSLHKKRDTHFLCFPLTSDSSVPQLAGSLRHFREVTTKPSRYNERHAGDAEEDAAPDYDEVTKSRSTPNNYRDSDSIAPEPNVNQLQTLSPVCQDLQLLPAITHRPPGTFHLTLGVMDLSTQEEMDRALKLLQEIDYTELFRYALSLQNKTESPNNHSAEEEDPEMRVESLQRPVSPPALSRKSTNSPTFGTDNPPKIALTGLSTFPSAKTSRVFFAKPAPLLASPFPLLGFGQAIRRKFREAGFITETRPLVLHATVANMRYAVQARGGRTSKGKAWRFGKDRWKDGQVDAREIIKCFDCHGGNVDEYITGRAATETHEYVWATDIALDRVAICKMGAEKSQDEVLGMVYPPVGEKYIF